MTELTLTNRIAEDIPLDQYTPEQQAVIAGFDMSRRANITGTRGVMTSDRIWIQSPNVAAAMDRLCSALVGKSSLNTREYELTICMAANHWHGDFAWGAHVKFACDAGMSPQIFKDIKEGREPKFDTERERAVYDIARMAEQPGHGPDEIWNRCIAVLGRNGIAEVISLLGYYSSMAIAMKLHRVLPNKN